MTIGSAVQADPATGLESSRPSKDRMFSLDLIRATAIIMVVVLHSTSPVKYQIGQVPTEYGAFTICLTQPSGLYPAIFHAEWLLFDVANLRRQQCSPP